MLDEEEEMLEAEREMPEALGPWGWEPAPQRHRGFASRLLGRSFCGVS